MKIELIQEKVLRMCLADGKHSVGISYYFLKRKIIFGPILYSISNILTINSGVCWYFNNTKREEVDSRILDRIEFLDLDS